MKNIHILPTDKPSRLIQAEDDELMLLNELYENTHNINKHIYITSDEEIKLGDWFIYLGQINKRTRKNPKAEYPFSNYQKIILTTDDQLIKDGVQDIDNEFLEWFAKNPSCEHVKVEKEHHTEIEEVSYEGDFQNVDYIKYKVIIPKEESKQELSLKINDEFLDTTSKEILYTLMEEFDNLVTENSSEETLEEVAEKIADNFEEPNFKAGVIYGFIEGAKWQKQQMYNEEEARSIWKAGQEYWKTSGDSITFEELTEQFKK